MWLKDVQVRERDRELQQSLAPVGEKPILEIKAII